MKRSRWYLRFCEVDHAGSKVDGKQFETLLHCQFLKRVAGATAEISKLSVSIIWNSIQQTVCHFVLHLRSFVVRGSGTAKLMGDLLFDESRQFPVVVLSNGWDD